MEAEASVPAEFKGPSFKSQRVGRRSLLGRYRGLLVPLLARSRHIRHEYHLGLFSSYVLERNSPRLAPARHFPVALDSCVAPRASGSACQGQLTLHGWHRPWLVLQPPWLSLPSLRLLLEGILRHPASCLARLAPWLVPLLLLLPGEPMHYSGCWRGLTTLLPVSVPVPGTWSLNFARGTIPSLAGIPGRIFDGG